MNQNVFKHLSLLAIFTPFLELGVLSLGKRVEPCLTGQMLSLFKNKLLEEAGKSSETRGKEWGGCLGGEGVTACSD